MVQSNVNEITKYLLKGFAIEPRLKLLFLVGQRVDKELLKIGFDRWNISPNQEQLKIYDRKLFLLVKREQSLMDELGFTYNGFYPLPNKNNTIMWELL